MEASADVDQSLKSTFVTADGLRVSLERTFDCNGESYQTQLTAAIRTFEECKRLVTMLSLFSPNETLEDISSSELKCVRASPEVWCSQLN